MFNSDTYANVHKQDDILSQNAAQCNKATIKKPKTQNSNLLSSLI